MAYPEKVSYPEKYNLRPIIEPDGQWSAENANHIKEKVNKNALFHDVHDNLAALQAAFPNPPVGAFAYLKDGSHYRCVNIGWVTNEGGGGESTYFKGYYSAGNGQTALEKLTAAHPTSIPGARAILRVTGGNDKEALWDEDDQQWFEFAVESVVSKTYVDDQDEATLQAAKDHANSLVGGDTSPRLYSFYAAHLQDLDYRVTGYFSFPEEGNFGTVENPIVQDITLSPGDAANDRIDMIVANSQGNFEVIEGIPSENPEEPSYDISTQIRCTIIFVGANATTPTNKTETIVYAEGAAGEFDATAHYPTGMGNSITIESANSPISETVSIEGTNVGTYQAINFIPSEPIPVDGITGFEYLLKNKNIPNQPTHRIQVHGKKQNGQDIIIFLNAAEQYGYDPQDLTAQKISLPFIVGNQMKEVTRIRFVVYCETSINWGFWLDNVKLIGGEEAPVPNAYVTREDMESAIAASLQEAKDYADSLDIGSGASEGGISSDPNQALSLGSDNKPYLSVDDLGEGGSATVKKILNSKSASAAHRPSALSMPSYDGTTQGTHPSVVYFPNGFNGYKYWMAYTPYPDANDDYENPSIVASNDKINWVVPTGLVNPIEPEPTNGRHNSDTELVLGYDGKLYCYWRSVSVGDGTHYIYVKSSVDGIVWSDPKITVLSHATAMLSPCIIKENSGYTMYEISGKEIPERIFKRFSMDPEDFSTATRIECTFEGLPLNHSIWHFGITKVNGIDYCVMTTYRSDQALHVGCELLFGIVENNHFKFTGQSFLKAGNLSWCDNYLYRAFMLPAEITEDGVLWDLWYGAVSTSGQWYIGYTQIDTFFDTAEPENIIYQSSNFQLSREDHKMTIEADSDNAQVCTIPEQTEVPIPIGFYTTIFWRNLGAVSFTQGPGVTVLVDPAEDLEIYAQNNGVRVLKIAANTWRIVGALKKLTV